MGPMVIEGGLDVQEGWNKIPTRVLVLQQTAVSNGSTVRPGPHGPFVPAAVHSTAGSTRRSTFSPDELQRWRIFNATAGTFVDLQLDDQAVAHPRHPTGTTFQHE